MSEQFLITAKVRGKDGPWFHLFFFFHFRQVGALTMIDFKGTFNIQPLGMLNPSNLNGHRSYSQL